MSGNPVLEALSSVSLGPATIVDNLVMFPLLGGPGCVAEPSYLTLDDALERGLASVTEVSEQGSVPELKVVNHGDRPTFILDGQELVGAKQNRIVNLSILVPATSELTIPVSCVEAGRWSARSRSFSSAPRTQYASGRAKRMKQVTASMLVGAGRVSDQAEVWSDIAEKSARLDARSPTSAMEAIYEGHAVSVDRFVLGCRPVDRQVGAVFAIDGQIAGLEIFDCESVLRTLLPKIVRGYAIDAIDRRLMDQAGGNPDTLPSLVGLFMSSVAGSAGTSTSAVGLGTDVRLSANGLTGAALVTDHVVHLSAFAD